MRLVTCLKPQAMDYLLNKSFLLFRGLHYPKILHSHEQALSNVVAHYAYIKYVSATTDLIPKYKEAADIHVRVSSVSSVEPFNSTHIAVTGPGLSHDVVFVQINDQVLVFIRSGTPHFLTQSLEDLDFESALILKPLRFSSSAIAKIVNGLRPLLLDRPLVLGNVTIKFAPRKPLQNGSLEDVVVEIPPNDTTIILKDADLPMDAIYAWLEKATTLNFELFDIKAFSCNVLALSSTLVKLSESLLEERDIQIVVLLVAEAVNAEEITTK